MSRCGAGGIQGTGNQLVQPSLPAIVAGAGWWWAGGLWLEFASLHRAHSSGVCMHCTGRCAGIAHGCPSSLWAGVLF